MNTKPALIIVLAVLSLVSCATSFNPRTHEELRDEAFGVYASPIGRVLIDERPAVLTQDAPAPTGQCAQDSVTVAKWARDRGLRSWIVEVRLPWSKEMHSFAAIEVDGSPWAVDGYSLPWCDRVCSLGEALHGVEFVDARELVAQ